MTFDLSGHTALVTGSSRGIGSAIALELANAGASVIVHSSKPSSAADDMAAKIDALGKLRAVIAADLSKPD